MNSDKEVTKSLNKIENLDKILNDLSRYYSELKSETITREDIFDTLYLCLNIKFDWEHPLDFWDLDISYDEAKNTLINFDFKTIFHKVESEKDIIPQDLLMKTKAQIKSKGLIWLIHKYDADPFPSNPHAHELGSGLKLDLRNGKCYRKKKQVATIKKKDLIKIRIQASKDFDLPKLEI
ncbi:hypothetical protein [Flavobacterium granuli]|uniref:Uncharacterized protein n=1 Tax=Flavobacterium granuli TaxID=280093 RepID=A0ABU1S1U3_9FLAO|nr:hypothetical protein [Flavobacterium granuli]MDR6844099.1 hypothetical protein [Flavobacterium granuli]